MPDEEDKEWHPHSRWRPERPVDDIPTDGRGWGPLGVLAVVVLGMTGFFGVAYGVIAIVNDVTSKEEYLKGLGTAIGGLAIGVAFVCWLCVWLVVSYHRKPSKPSPHA